MFQCQLKHLVDPLDRVNVELVLDVVRNLGQVLDVFLRNQHCLDAASVGGEQFFCEQVHVRWPIAPAATPKFAAYQSVLMDVLSGRRPPFAAIWMCLFSGQLVEYYPFTMVATTYTPLSPTRTRLRSEYYFDREIAETRRDYVESSLTVLDEVTGEDHEAAVLLQEGRQALWSRGENSQGPYQMPMEQGLRRFHDCLRGIVQNA